MEYVELGDTGETVSRLGFGGAPAGLPNYLGEYDPSESSARARVIEAIEQALDCGVTYFDTAPGYGEGISEEIFGEALAGEDVFVATKVELGDRTHVRNRVTGSLERLRRESIELLQIHGESYTDEDVKLIQTEMLPEMEALREEGKVRYLGFTTEDNNPATYELVSSGEFDTMQINYNVLFQHPYNPISDSGSLLEAADAGMGTITMRTLTSGIFQSWIETVHPDVSFEYAPALLQFVLSNESVDVALVGMRNPRIVEENAALVDDIEGRIDIEELFNRYV